MHPPAYQPPCQTSWTPQALPRAACPPAPVLHSMLRHSSDGREQAAPAHADRPAPELPCLLASIDGEENHLGATDQVLLGHVAHARGDCARQAVAGNTAER